MNLHATGAMNFKFDFEFSGSKAEVCVDGNSGLSIKMDGFVLHLSEDKGCELEMHGGVKFTLPLQPKDVKKAS